MASPLAHLEMLGYGPDNPDTVVPSNFIGLVESALDYPLPADYREFLAAAPYNGGTDNPIKVPVIGGDGATVSWLCLFGHAPEDRVGLIEMNVDNLDFYRPGYMIIGDDDFGNFLYLGVTEADPGVYYFDRTGGPGPQSWLKIGENFTDFALRTELDGA